MAKIMAFSMDNLNRAIWKLGPAWVGGDLNDVEVRAIMKVCEKLIPKLYGKKDGGENLTVNELAAAALQHYFSR